MNIRQTLYREASSVRRWALHQENAEHPDLGGWCAVCSTKIFKRLNQLGLNPTFFLVDWDDDCHCFVMCNGYLIDVTARQFDYDCDKINIVFMANKISDHWFWSTYNRSNIRVEQAHTLDEIRSMLYEWPRYQNPFKLFSKWA